MKRFGTINHAFRSGGRLLLLGVILFQIGVNGCKEEKDPDLDTSTHSVAQEMVEKIGNQISLILTGMPASVLSHLKECALSKLIEQNLLASSDVALIAAAIAEGMMTGLSNFQDSELSNQPSTDTSVQSPHKKQAIATIAGQLIKELNQTLKDDDFSTAVNTVIISLTAGFSSAGLITADMGPVAGAVINQSLHTLDDLEVEAETILELSAVLLQAAIAGSASEGNQLQTEEIQALVKKSLVSTIVALHEIEILTDDIIAQLETWITASVTGLGEAGLKAAELAGLSDSIKTGIVDGLSAIGVSNTAINELYPTIDDTCDQAVATYINANPDVISRDLLVARVDTNLAQIDGASGIVLTSAHRTLFRVNLTSATDQAGLAGSDNLNALLPVAVQSVMTTLGQLMPALIDAEKAEVLENLLGSIVGFLSGRVSGADAIVALETVTQPAVDHIPRLQLAAVPTQEALLTVCQGLVKPLGSIPLGEKTVGDAASAIVAKVISRSATLGLGASGEQVAMQSCVTGAVKGLGQTDLSLDDHDAAVAGLIKVATGEAVAKLIADGKTGADLIAAMPDLSNQLLSAVAAAELSTAACSELAAEIVSGASAELSSVLDTDALGEALSNTVDGIKSGLAAAGASATEIESAEKSGMEASDAAVAATVSPTAAKLIISDEKLSTQEGSNDNGSFKVSLDKIPTADVTVAIYSKDTSEGTVAPASLLLTAENWNKPQTVYIKPEDDGFVDKEVSYPLFPNICNYALSYLFAIKKSL